MFELLYKPSEIAENGANSHHHHWEVRIVISTYDCISGWDFGSSLTQKM